MNGETLAVVTTLPLGFLQTLLIVLLIALTTFFTRGIAFVLFPENRPTPPYVDYLGKTLPFAAIGMLVVYCLKGVRFTASPHGIPETVAILVIVLLHRWKHSTLLSISVGTILYMALVQNFFA